MFVNKMGGTFPIDQIPKLHGDDSNLAVLVTIDFCDLFFWLQQKKIIRIIFFEEMKGRCTQKEKENMNDDEFLDKK